MLRAREIIARGKGPGDVRLFKDPFFWCLWFSDLRYVSDLKRNTYPRSSRYYETPFGTNNSFCLMFFRTLIP